ncbi:MAG: cell wall hydrolase [Pseudomonadota bacterium]
MTPHRSSIPLNAEFTPPPAIQLGRARADDSVIEPEVQAAIEPASASASKWSFNTNMRKRLAIVLAVLAVPAVAAPGDFGAMAGDAPAEPEGAVTIAYDESVMAFEQPGMSFPGSAFYYLADPPRTLVALPTSNPSDRSADSGREVGSLIDAGPAARAFLAGTGTNYIRAQDCLAQAIWYEAASESEAGKRAVAQVVLNRVAHPSWPDSVCGVVYQGSQRSTGCQFSFTCDGSLSRRAPSTLRGKTWSAARQIAGEALNGSVYAPIGHATHYHTLWVDPYWAKTLDTVGVIGAHRFYRNRGRLGEKAAFSHAYTGTEPTSAARARPALDAPIPVVEKDALVSSVTAPKPGPTPPSTIGDEALANPELSTSGQARKEYARAGRWKVDPSQLNLGDKGAQDDAPQDPSL